MDPWMSTAQAADALGVSTGRVRQLLLARHLPGRKLGREWLILRADLRRFMALDQGVKGSPRALHPSAAAPRDKSAEDAS